MASYGFSFGIELTADNVLSQYFQDYFDQPATHAGDLAAVFGLFNVLSRPLGKNICPLTGLLFLLAKSQSILIEMRKGP